MKLEHGPTYAQDNKLTLDVAETIYIKLPELEERINELEIVTKDIMRWIRYVMILYFIYLIASISFKLFYV